MTSDGARRDQSNKGAPVLAGLSGSPGQVAVLGYAKLFAEMYGAQPCALHVAGPGHSNLVGEFAFREHAGLRVVDGDPVQEIVRAARHPDVRLVVVGTHTPPNGHGPGAATLDIATRLDRPLLVVPAGATVPVTVDRVLLPLDGTSATTTTIGDLIEHLPFGRDTELFVVHTFTSEDMPPFANHQPHETEEWGKAFRRRYVPCGVRVGEVVMRSGRPERAVPEVAETLGATLTVVSWSQTLAPGHALVVKALVSDPKRPTLLVPSTYRPSSRRRHHQSSERMSTAGAFRVGTSAR